MAIFSMDIASNLDTADDIRKVKSYLYQLNEQLRYMFSNLDVDENYNDKTKLMYAETEDKISTLEVSVDGINATVQDNTSHYNTSIQVLANALNLTSSTPSGSSSAVLSGNQITLSTGKFIINSSNLTVDANGNATFSGNLNGAGGTFSGTLNASTINGGTINGTTINSSTLNSTNIEGADGLFAVNDSEVYVGGFYGYYVDGTPYLASEDGSVGFGMSDTYQIWAGESSSSGFNPKFYVNSYGYVYCDDLYFRDQDYNWRAWPLSSWIRWIDELLDG